MNTSMPDLAWVITQSVLMPAVIVLGVKQRGAWHSDVGLAAGGVLFALGAIVGIWGVRSLGRNITPLPTPKQDTELVQHGIYRWLRHPLYSSVMLASLGWTLLWQSAAALGVSVVLCGFFDAKARLEERLLLERFHDYVAYRERTWRFLPGIY